MERLSVSGNLFAVMCRLCFFFFFQAEDGIRDSSVTGVQTCALPISQSQHGRAWFAVDVELSSRTSGRGHDPVINRVIGGKRIEADKGLVPGMGSEIGRASCRERV